jgi:hypothetical protein
MCKLFNFFVLGMLFALSSACSKETSEVISHKGEQNPESTGPDVMKYQDKWYKAGDTIYGYKKYVFIVVGDKESPLILGIPHDGVLEGSPVIPETGDTGRDLNTNPFATAIAGLFKQETGFRPWIMVNLIGRKRVDPNTYPSEIDTRYTNEDAKKTWYSYHELLTAGRAVMAESLKTKAGGLFIDVHGHAHKYHEGHQVAYTSATTGNPVLSDFIDQTEVGYALSSYALEQNDTYLNTLADSSSIYAISKAHPNVQFSALIRGADSFGGLLQSQAVNAVPGSLLQKLDRDALLFGTLSGGRPDTRPYFTGGYLTRKYGTVQKGSTTGYNDNISSLQIETPGITVRNNASVIAVSAPRFKKAIVNYLNKWYGYSFSNNL